MMDANEEVMVLQDLARELRYFKYGQLNLKGLDPLRAEVDSRLHEFTSSEDRDRLNKRRGIER